MAGKGFGAGFVEGATAGGQLNNQRDQIEAMKSYRDQELGLKAQEFMLQQARLNHQDAKDFYKDQLDQHNSLVGAVTKGLENGKSEVWHQNPAQWEALLSNLSTSQRLLAGARANAFGGDHNSHLQDIGNTDQGLLGASTSMTDKSFAKALADRTGLKTGQDVGLPSAEGQAAGQKELATATSGGATSAGMIRAAQEANTPRAMTPEQRLVIPPLGSLPGQGGAPTVASPIASVVSPQLPSAMPQAQAQAMPTAQPMPNAPQQPGTLIPPAMQPGTYQAETELGKNFGSEKEQQGYRGAQAGMQNLYQILASADQLNKSGGWQNTGSGSDFRNNLAKQVNSWATSFNLQKPFDANRVGSWEDLTKNTKLMGMQVISSYFGGSREAQSIVQAGINAVPSAENTPLGVRLVGSGIEQAMSRQIQMHDFIASRIASNQPISTAESEFNRQNPPGMYAMRSIANAVPDIYAHGLQAGAYTPQQIDNQFGPGVAQFILSGHRTGIGAAGGFPAPQ